MSDGDGDLERLSLNEELEVDNVDMESALDEWYGECEGWTATHEGHTPSQGRRRR